MAACVLLQGCQWFQTKEPEAPEDHEEQSFQRHALKYNITFTGDVDGEMNDAMEDASVLVSKRKKPPVSLNALYRRAEGDMENMEQALASLGYFDADVTFDIEGEKEPYEISVNVDPGPRYTIASIAVLDATQKDKGPRLDITKKVKHVKLHVDRDVLVEEIKEAAEDLKTYLRHNGYPYAEVEDPEAIIDRGKKVLHVKFFVESGPFAPFGEVHVKGVKNVPDAFVDNRILWKEGETYNEMWVERTRQQIINTGVFGSVVVKPEKQLAPDGSVPMKIKVKEAKPRTLSGGARFASSEGASLTAMWRHMNLSKKGDSFTSQLQIGQLESNVDVIYKWPDFFHPKLTWINHGLIQMENTRSYKSRIGKMESKLQWQFTRITSGFVGIVAHGGRVRQAHERFKSLRFFGIPMEVKVDARNDFLNPTSGGKFEIGVTPYWGKIGDENNIVVAKMGGTFYAPLDIDEIFVIAGWANVGHIFAKNLFNVPANMRFYSGGASSVRGYGFQMLGPLDLDDKPTGGLSMLEGGLELRVRTHESFGFAAFIECGNVNQSKHFRFKSSQTLYAGGVGLRYYVSGLVFRADVAVPLKRRRGPSGKRNIDSRFQFVASIGQAF